MKFCEKCGSYMRATKEGYKCSKCGYSIPSDAVEVKTIEQRDVSPVAVVSGIEEGQAKVLETCPSCGNPEAFRTVSFVSGEHAGVRQERSMERFTCAKCGHSWTKQ
jgi:DNA-directed RNA polymerase subunit M/transcription elongation factor TFIIS